jgi:hypothetical protein
MRYSTLRKTGLLGHELILAAVILAGGCGQPQTVLTGLVTLDGKPIAGANLEFFPINGVGRVSVTETDASGRFRVTVAPSALSVTVIAIEVVGKIPDPAFPGSMIDDARDVFPQEYASHETTPLTAEPVEDKTTTIDFPLTSAENQGRR